MGYSAGEAIRAEGGAGVRGGHRAGRWEDPHEHWSLGPSINLACGTKHCDWRKEAEGNMSWGNVAGYYGTPWSESSVNPTN